VIGEQNTLHP